MPKITGQGMKIEFTKTDTIFTARAGLVPINEAAKDMGIYNKIDSVCKDLRQKNKTDFRPSQFFMFVVMGILSGFPRVHTMLISAEEKFLSKLVNFVTTPVASTFSRFFAKFEEEAIQGLMNLNFQLASKTFLPIGGYQVIVHDQSAIQKYGKKMEGVEKGYGGTLKKGSKMLQASLIIDAGNQKVLFGDIKPGSTHTYNNAANELDTTLTNLDEISSEKRLILADSGYGVGEYMKVCDEHEAEFILGIKNDSWMKKELETLDFKNFRLGKLYGEYGYREFVADRDCWNADNEALIKEEWEGQRRIVVVRLPPSKKGPEYLFLATSLGVEEASAEEIHVIYRKDRETIEQLNDELKNQLKFTELPAQKLDANRAFAQAFFLAWNLQRQTEIIAFEKEREQQLNPSQKHKSSTLPKKSLAYRKPNKIRYEWWTIFCSYIAVGGKLKVGGNKLRIIAGKCPQFQSWVSSLETFDWSSCAI